MTSRDLTRAVQLAARHEHLRKSTHQSATLLLLACLIIVGLGVWQLAEDYSLYRQQHETDVVNLSTILLHSAETSVLHSGTILLGLIERLEQDGDSPAALARLRGVLADQIRHYPEIQAVVIYDRDGVPIFSTLDQLPTQNAADRGYFQHHQQNPGLEAHIGRPIRSRTTTDWIITVSRRMNDPDGQFAGTALVTLRVATFLEQFRGVELGPNGVVTLMRADHAILIRQPFREAELYLDFSQGPVARQISAGKPAGVLRYDSPVDGVRRVVGFRASDRAPIYVLVGLEERHAFAAWWQTLYRTVWVMLAALVTIAWLGLRTLFGLRQRLEVESVLLQAHRDLSELNDSLEILSSADELTGLATRRQFDLSLNQAFLRVDHEPLSLVLLELDGFKLLRESHGQQAADERLQQIAGLLRGQLRRSLDLPARFASDRLAVILPGTDAAGAETVAENIRAAIERADIANRGSAGGMVTASLGVSSCLPWQNCQQPDALVLEAEQALADAINAGRNRVAQRMTRQR
ncbi:sensor domain-containing diguanylate cyclase [Stutzerimonas tarimensis]|uniref:diguanylate cyclase n=1 Tax=Stutzerimonas tarimensis TaxID=1507735 RepID=A0ABV7T6G7_9GAMM